MVAPKSNYYSRAKRRLVGKAQSERLVFKFRKISTLSKG